MVDGEMKTLLVHRKGATRAFPPHHPLVPLDYQLTGQPVLIGGTMGTASYVLTGTDKGMADTWGSTCHGAGRARSRNNARHKLDYQQVLAALKTKGIAIRVARCEPFWLEGRGLSAALACLDRWGLGLARSPPALDALPWPAIGASTSPLEPMPRCSPKLVMEEAPESYKDVDDVIETCHAAGISRKVVKLRPIAVIKG